MRNVVENGLSRKENEEREREDRKEEKGGEENEENVKILIRWILA